MSRNPDAAFEGEALAAIGNDALPFSARVELLDRVHAAQAGETAPEVRERLLLLWLRTLRWTLYGELDMTTLHELPAGRKPIETFVVDGARARARAYERAREEIRAGR